MISASPASCWAQLCGLTSQLFCKNSRPHQLAVWYNFVVSPACCLEQLRGLTSQVYGINSKNHQPAAWQNFQSHQPAVWTNSRNHQPAVKHRFVASQASCLAQPRGFNNQMFGKNSRLNSQMSGTDSSPHQP